MTPNLRFWLARGAELTTKLRLHLGVLATLRGDDSMPVTLALMDMVAVRPERLHDLMEGAVEKAERDAGFRELMADGYQPPPLDLEVLAGFDAGTLGKAVASMPVVVGKRQADLDDTFSFLTERVRASLPAWKALVGGDDLTLQSFVYAQTECPVACLVIAFQLYRTAALAPLRLPHAVKGLADGFAAGQRSAYLPGLRLEDEWGSGVAELRKRLGIA